MNPITTPIIITGAGPTGLMLANQLTRFGIDYIILDQKSGPTDQSRALVVQARSLEIYEQLGLADEVIAKGQPNYGMDFYKEGKMQESVTLINKDETASPYPYLLMYEQSKNEALLYKNLLHQNKDVQWDTTVTSISEENGGYTLTTTANNTITTYQCEYLIACDGSKSIVREFSGVPFVGGSYLNVFFVADTKAEGGFSPDKLSMFLTKKGITVLFPMVGDNHFRVLGVLPKEYYHKEEVSFEEILDKTRADMQLPVKFYDTNWHSTYKLHHKKVARFSKDNIFFAGDAAHVHSPAGGQGMNTGLQDAYNLAWKLALVIKGTAGKDLLDTYHEERNPIAETLLSSTDRLFSYMSSENSFFGFIRMHILPLVIPFVTRFKKIRRELFFQASQLRINYEKSTLSKGKAGNIKAGDRMPYTKVMADNKLTSIYSLINSKTDAPFTIIAYRSAAAFEALPDSRYNHLKIEENDFNNKAFEAIGLPAEFVIVLRPDNYIAFCATEADPDAVDHFIRIAYALK